MGFPRQEYWSGLSFSSPGDHPDPGIEPRGSRAFREDPSLSEPQRKPGAIISFQYLLFDHSFMTQHVKCI